MIRRPHHCKLPTAGRLAPLGLLLVLLGGCNMVVMNPMGDVALQQRNLFTFATAPMLADRHSGHRARGHPRLALPGNQHSGAVRARMGSFDPARADNLSRASLDRDLPLAYKFTLTPNPPCLHVPIDWSETVALINASTFTWRDTRKLTRVPGSKQVISLPATFAWPNPAIVAPMLLCDPNERETVASTAKLDSFAEQVRILCRRARHTCLAHPATILCIERIARAGCFGITILGLPTMAETGAARELVAGVRRVIQPARA
jgi:hypothetical protein